MRSRDSSQCQTRSRLPWKAAYSSTLLLFLVLQAPSLFAQAQAFTASLSGSVVDNSGAAVPGATVTLTNPDKRFSQTFTTGADGRYTFTLLPPGNYVLKIEKADFRPYEQSGITLAVGQPATQDVTLQLGTFRQQVTVTAAAPMLNVTNANVASDVTQRQAVELPLNLRNVFGLVALNSSVNNSQQNQALNPQGSVSDFDDQDIAFFNFGGGRFGTTAFMLDGHWNAAGDWAGTIYVPGVDEIQEYKIQTNAFTAQYGWSMGNVVNAVTKSGGSAFHGDVFEFLRNSDLDSNNFFNNAAGVPRPQFKESQFGFTAGGPLYIPHLYQQRDKTFIFGAYQGRRQSTPDTLVATFPTADMRGGDFSALLGAQIGTDGLGRPVYSGQIYNPLSTRSITAGQVDPVTGLTATQTGSIRDPLPGNMIPSSLIDSVSKNILPYWPNATSSGLVNNFTASAGVPSGEDAYTIRIDQNISDKSRAFGRWSQKRQHLTLGGPFLGATNPGGPGNYVPDNRFDAAFDYNHVFNPAFVMSVDLGFGRWDEGRVPQSVPFTPSSLGLPSFIDGYGGESAFPSISIDGYYGLGGGVLNSTPREARTYSVDFTKIHGPHTMNIGFTAIDFHLTTFNSSVASFYFPLAMTQGPDPLNPTSGTGSGFASFLLGTGASGGITLNARAAFDKTFYGWYFQDDWKATRKLTLNLGIRYDIQTAPKDRFNRLSYFDPTASNPVASAANTAAPGELVYTSPSMRGVYDVPHNNFAPRIGLAYQAASKLVVRGGFGMFYIPSMEFGDYQGLVLNGFSQTTPYVGTINGITPVNLLSDPFPGGLLQPPGKSAGALTNVGYGTNAILRNRPTPYVEQWSLGGQYAITPNDMLDITYVANHGVKLPLASTVNYDALPISDLSLGTSLLDNVTNPFYGFITSSGCGLDGKTVLRGQLLLPFPQYCSVSYAQPVSGESNYNALQVNFTHHWAGGLQMLLSYTFSKYLDQSSGAEGWTSGANQNYESVYNLRNEYSTDIDDIPHSFVASYIYALPVGRGKRFASSMNGITNAVLGGWQVSGITTAKVGFPLGFSAPCNYAYCQSQRPNLVGDPNSGPKTVSEWFNTSAFAEPAPFTFGNVPRTTPYVRAPGYYDWDLGIDKTWAWQEKMRIQFRAELFNAFNRANFYAPNTGFEAPAFGQISAALPARDVQFALKVYW